jgi:DNA-binding SARP family transcriptional activator
VIRCRVLGPLEVESDGDGVPAALRWRKHIGLLIYLARSPNGTRSRDHLIGVFWAEKPEEAARHSLTEALRVIRRALGDGAIESTPGHVRLAASALDLDADRFAALERQSDPVAATDLVRGEFLEGFAVPDAWEFEEWLAAERRDWRPRTTAALVRAAELRLDAGDAAAAAALAGRALRIDATAEPAWRAGMLALAVVGNRAGALEMWEECGRVLDDRIGTEPEPATQELAARIRRERQWSPTLPADAGAESRRPPLVGRDAALRQALAICERCAAGSGAAVLVVSGQPGSGRTRFAEEVATRSRLAGSRAVTVRAVEADMSGAGTTLATLLRAVQDLQPAAQTQALHEAAADSLLLLTIDDAQHADADSLLAVAAHLRDHARDRVCFLLTRTRFPHRLELDEIAARAGRDLPGALLELEPLGGAAMADLVRWALPAFDPADVERAVRRLTVDSGGLPLLAVETLNAIALGLEPLAGSVWPQPTRTMDHTLPGPIPEALTAALRVNFQRLPAAVARVLATLAVLGERVPAERLALAADLPPDDFWDALEELEWRRWIVAEPRGYAFTARVAAQIVLRDLTTSAQRRRIRARAAAADPAPAV